MRSTRVSGILMAVFFVASILTPGAARHVLLFASFAAAGACVVSLAVEVRRGYPSRGLLILAAPSAVLYAGGRLYLVYWSSDGDIGGGLPFFLGLVGVLTIAATVNVKPLKEPGGR